MFKPKRVSVQRFNIRNLNYEVKIIYYKIQHNMLELTYDKLYNWV